MHEKSATAEPRKNSRRRWYQLTIARVLGAAFWIGVRFALVALSKSDGLDLNPVLSYSLLAAIYTSPCIAIGTLVGRPLVGLLAGLAIFCATVLGVSIGFEK